MSNENNRSSDIGIVVDSYNSVENGMMQRMFSKKYNFPIEGLVTSPELMPKMMTALKNKYDFKEYNFTASTTNQMYILEEVNDSFFIMIRSGVKGALIIDVYTKTIAEGETLFHLIREYEDLPSTLAIKIVSFSLGSQGQLEKSTITKNQDDFKSLSKLYYPFLDIDEMFKQYLISNDNLLLLAGRSGTGKTEVINMLLDFATKNEELLFSNPDDEEDDDNIYVAYVKNPQILAMDAFWSTLSKSNFNFIVMDDMDFILTDRTISDGSHTDETRLRFISNFLSYTDGIFTNNTKFIITTNRGVNNIDSAILRKGRCFDVLSFRDLTKVEAKAIWIEAELPEDKFSEEFKEDVINAADLGSKIEMYNNLLLKGATIKSSYIKEDGISLYNKNFDRKITI